MKSTRTRHTPAFKAKVALAAVREQETAAEIARRYGLHVNQIYKWKKEFLEKMSRIFEMEGTRSDGPDRESELLKKIGELTVERDFLARGLGRLG